MVTKDTQPFEVLIYNMQSNQKIQDTTNSKHLVLVKINLDDRDTSVRESGLAGQLLMIVKSRKNTPLIVAL